MADRDTLARYLIPGTDDDVIDTYLTLADPERFTAPSLIERDYIVVDTETTGFDPARCALIEIAAARVRGNDVIERFDTFVNPGRSIPSEIEELTSITNADVKGAPSPEEAVAAFAEFAQDDDLVAHNAAFDRSFVMRQARPGMLKGDWLDSLTLSQIVLPRFRSHRLHDLACAYALHSSTHRADDDVEATVGLWQILLRGLQALEPGLARYIADLSPETDWPLRKLFSEAADALSGTYLSFRQSRDLRIRDRVSKEKYDADEIPLFHCADEVIRDDLSSEGLAGQMYPNYEQREEQVQMALEVNDALREESFSVIEAGTGVGKSMAYLIPCAHFATRNAVPVGIATKTNTLMDQLVYHELPRLKRVWGDLDYVALKGYEHYPCLRKIEQAARRDDLDVDAIQMIATLAGFTAQTSWGDLDALNIHWAGLPQTAVRANPNDCLKKRCPFFPKRCYLHGLRRFATGADIIVTNHALLFRDLQMDNGILPHIRHWIIDEAHSVESEARRQLSVSIGSRDLEFTLRRITGTRNGLTAAIRRKADTEEGGDMVYGVCVDIDTRADQLIDCASSFFAYVEDLAAEDGGSFGTSTLWIGDELREGALWQRLVQPGRTLLEKLDGLIKRLNDLSSMLEQFEGSFSSQEAEIAATTSRLSEMGQALSLVLDGTDDSYVYSVEVRAAKDRTTETLTAQKLDIGKTLADSFYPALKTVVYTSATLSTGSGKDPFAHFLHTTGLDRVEKDRVRCVSLSSSYDFEHNMSILLPDDIPEPNDRAYRNALADLLFQVHVAMGGSVLTLFTNRREMEEQYRLLKPKLAAEGIDLAAQLRTNSTKALRDRFLQERELSLFALKSFWEGFDAPGDTLRCVVIPKLPFGRPNDPIARERENRESRAAWRRYSLPEAIKDLKQACGRLIRSSTDSGWIILADARLQTRRYGSQFLKAMPTTDIRTMTSEEIAETLASEKPGKPS